MLVHDGPFQAHTKVQVWIAICSHVSGWLAISVLIVDTNHIYNYSFPFNVIEV